MSEKPQETRDDDLLEQIITQGLEKIKAPTQATATEEIPPGEAPSTPEQGSGVSPSADRKNRRSAVYLYLLVLFGAAFLMLLLAYFVQQRSSEDAISDLRESMNLSRAELLSEIKELERRNAELEERIAAQRGELSNVYVECAQWQKWYEEVAIKADDLKEQNIAAQEKLNGWAFIWALEHYDEIEDYETCARFLLWKALGEISCSIPNATLWRYQEFVQHVIDAGILKEDYEQHPEDYREMLRGHSFFLDFN